MSRASKETRGEADVERLRAALAAIVAADEEHDYQTTLDAINEARALLGEPYPRSIAHGEGA